jgi:hypothetical protein
MKAYIVTYLIAAVILSMMLAAVFAVILVLISFVTWSLPAVVPYAAFRIDIIGGFIAAIFYIRSPEGKKGVRSVEAIWK